MTDRPRAARRVEPRWGTMIGVDVRDPIADCLLDALFQWFDRVDALFSTWRDDSEINRLGRGEIKRQQTSPDMHEVLAACDVLLDETFGAFDIGFATDPRVSPRPGFGPIDPSGFVKGWAIERAAAMLEQEGIANFAINAGGDVLTRGRPEPDRSWVVGIQHPIQGDATAATVTGTDLAVATSGRYERGDHIIDPRTGAPATALLSATVVATDLGRADAYATAAVVLGEEAMDWLGTVTGIEAMIIDQNHQVTTTSGFAHPAIAAEV